MRSMLGSQESEQLRNELDEWEAKFDKESVGVTAAAEAILDSPVESVSGQVASGQQSAVAEQVTPVPPFTPPHMRPVPPIPAPHTRPTPPPKPRSLSSRATSVDYSAPMSRLSEWSPHPEPAVEPHVHD